MKQPLYSLVLAFLCFLTMSATALSASVDWKAEMIQPLQNNNLDSSNPAPYLRCEFKILGDIKDARIYASALGVYELRLNGQKVGDALFTPGWTSYHNRLQYQEYDVTRLLLNGENAVGIILGDGWYRGNLLGGRRNYYGDKLAAIAQLDITYTDGRREIFVTNGSWKATTGPIISSDIYNGEVYDARREIDGWDMPGYDDSGWSSVAAVSFDVNKLVATEAPPVRKISDINPVRMFTTAKGERLLDFGQNMTGRVAFSLRGEKGDTIRLLFGETLDDKGNFFQGNLRKAKATDEYIFKGTGIENYEPHFTFHGFRYVKVEGYDETLNPDNFIAKLIHTDLKRTGWFHCSDTLVNKLMDNICWSAVDNFFDIPMDCPQRDERLGWTADAQIFAPTACYLFDMSDFLSKWLKDLALEQRPDGSVYDIVPTLHAGTNKGHGSSGWGDAATVVPWTLYEFYGDSRILAGQYESMRGWVEYLRANSGDSYIFNGGTYGDWLAFRGERGDYPGATTDKDLVGTAYFARSTEILARSAGILGYTKDAEKYSTLLANIKAAFNREFVTENGRLASNTQTAYALALAFDLLPENRRTAAAARLAEDVRKFGHLTTGFLGTAEICNVLSEFGYHDLAYKLLFNKKYPSWLYPVTKGATTVWENWDAILPSGKFNKGSLNHYAFGAIGAWIFRNVGGIRQTDGNVGFNNIIIQPIPTTKITSARTEFITPHGKVLTDWKIRDSGDFVLSVEVPTDVMATIILPTTDSLAAEVQVKPGKHSFLIDKTKLQLSP